MLLQLLITLIQGVLDIVLGWTTIIELPFGLEDMLVTGTAYVRFVTTVFPPLAVMIEGFIWVIVWKMVLRILRIIPIIGRAFGSW